MHTTHSEESYPETELPHEEVLNAVSMHPQTHLSDVPHRKQVINDAYRRKRNDHYWHDIQYYK